MNMSYCRFHNTNIALTECLSILEDPEDETISKEEKDAAKILFKRFLNFCLDNGIVEDYNKETYTKMIDNFED